MKKILSTTILTIIVLSAIGQLPEKFKPPFSYGKYVHYDHRIADIYAIQPSVTYGNALNYRDNQTDYSPYASVDLYIKYRRKDCYTDNHKLKKPFVFVEGVSFDKQSVRSSHYSYLDYLNENINTDSKKPNTQVLSNALDSFNAANWGINPPVGYSTFNWATLVTGIDAEGLSDGEPLDVQKCPDLLNKLYNNGYDIIFVDFESGQQYIENNGFALSKALKQIKDSLDSNGSIEKLVVCGASMGGLVSRFAIRDLELNGGSTYDHCVGKFISFDAPQMGVNINNLKYLI